MRKVIKGTAIVLCTVAATALGAGAIIYFQVDDRVKISVASTPEQFINSKNVLRLDSTVVSTDSMTAYINVLTAQARVTGLAVSIISDGDIIYQEYFGQRNHSKAEPLAPGTVFYGASFSKTMLADITLQMAGEGLLNLDSPLFKYLSKPLPDYRTTRLQRFFGANSYDYPDLSVDDRYKKITARMCLSHTTGLPNWRWIEPDKKLKFKFEPGERYSYSGEGMFLLQLVLEKISDKDFEALAVERIFTPLNLGRSSFVWQRAYEGNYAIGHDAGENILGIPKRNAPNAAGSLSTTLEDFTEYFRAVLLQNTARYKLMTTKQVSIPFKQQFGPEANIKTNDNDSIDLGYGLGYGVYQTPSGRAFFKEGHDDGWQHYAVGFPDRGMALVLMANSDNAEGIFRELIEFTIGNRHTPWYWEGYVPFK